MEKKTVRKSRINNRDKIIETAIKLIGERGVEGTSLADIAKDVGISKGTLYYYYSSKNDLIFDITKDHMDKITANIFSLIESKKGETSLHDTLKLLIETLLKSETRTRLHLYLIQEVLSGNENLKERFVETYRQWFQMIQEGYSLLTSQQRDLTVQARILVAIIDGLIIQGSIGAGAIPVDEIIREMTRVLDEE
ncbi:MAG: TetR/AcrR family transcriptional regulator [Desulfobacteraceae bacterium]